MNDLLKQLASQFGDNQSFTLHFKVKLPKCRLDAGQSQKEALFAEDKSGILITSPVHIAFKEKQLNTLNCQVDKETTPSYQRS